MLTAAVGVGKPIIDTAYDVGELSKLNNLFKVE